MSYFITYQDDEHMNGGLTLKRCDTIEDVYTFMEDKINNHYYSLFDFTVAHGTELTFQVVPSPIKIKVKM